MFDLRKILVIIIIAVLYVVLAFAVTHAIIQKPDYNNFCGQQGMLTAPVKIAMETGNCTAFQVESAYEKECYAKRGYVEYKYDSRGCATEYYCNTCNADLEDATKKYDFWLFIIFSIMGLIALVIGLKLSPEQNELHKWVGSGFTAGSLAVLFIGTAIHYNEMLRYLRPFVILAEIAIVIYVFYKEMSVYNMIGAKEKGKTERKGKR
jgi:hypothetical protein